MTNSDKLMIDGENLRISDISNIANSRKDVGLADSARKKVIKSNQWVESIVAAKAPVYGINTGFGIFSDKSISSEDILALNRNLILSHAVGTGAMLEEEIVRAAMLIRANTLSTGFSGARPEIIDSLLAMLNAGVTPEIPSQGSLGSSGDLAPLSHLALVLATDQEDREDQSGWASFKAERLTGKAAMKAAKITRLTLGPKEGLALTNGATFSAAIAALSISLCTKLVYVADVATAMSLEALLGASAAFDARLHKARNHEGQIEVAKRIRALTKGSTLLDAAGRVQDAYSLRCAPQVLGPARETLNFVWDIVTREVNAATDNPLIFGPETSLSGGNFHGEPIGIAMDYLKIVTSELAAISERRTYHLTDGTMNAGLPAMLVDTPESEGLNSGMMMLQYTAASLVLENQALANPNSTHSLPTSGGKEDHNANAMTAARNAWQLAHNSAHIVAIELYCAARAIELRLREIPGAKLGEGVRKAFDIIRQEVPYQAGDALWTPEIEAVRRLILEGKLNLRN